jgi:periplasmic divalent cation tolerance protein
MTNAPIGTTLVEERLAACINIVPGLRSIYVYDGKMCRDQEALCVIKTRRTLWAALFARVLTLHPYEVPELIGLSPTDASAPYLAWVLSSTRAT